jgi:uncharacterized damage-inducible protein DinB
MLRFRMEKNPYAHCLGNRDARAVYASTPGLIHQAVCALTPEQIEAPISAGKWSPRQIVAHMADCEIVFSYRLRQVLAATVSEPALLQPFDQDIWAEHYSQYDLPGALELLRALRAWNVKLLGALSEADLERSGHHPERGEQTFGDIVAMVAGHDLNHLVQLQQLAVAEPS